MDNDWHKLCEVLQDGDLSLGPLGFGRTSTGEDSVVDAQRDAVSFRWRREGKTAWQLNLSEEQLAEYIRRLERENIRMPIEFAQALKKLREA